MKILMLTDVFFPDTIGGAGRMAFYLSQGLSERGHEVHVITRDKDTHTVPAFQKINSMFFIHRFFVPAKESLALAFYELRNSRRLAQTLSRMTDFDLVCTHQTLVSLGPLTLRELASKPVLHCYYSPWHEEFSTKKYDAQKGLEPQTFIMTFLLRWLEKRHIRKSNRVMVLSQYTRDQVTDLHHYPLEKVALIPGCVDLNHFQLPDHGKVEVKKQLQLPLDKKIFLTVRNLVPRMGLENLIQSFSASGILRQQGLLLIGGKGFLEERLKALVAALRLQACIRFLGFIQEENLTHYYQAADFFILPTKKLEGFGLVILEALACGTPVLGTPVGAIPELLGPFADRLIMKGNGWQAMQAKLEETITRPDKYIFDPSACRDYVQNHYTYKRLSDVFEKLVLDTIKGTSKI